MKITSIYFNGADEDLDLFVDSYAGKMRTSRNWVYMKALRLLRQQVLDKEREPLKRQWRK